MCGSSSCHIFTTLRNCIVIYFRLSLDNNSSDYYNNSNNKIAKKVDFMKGAQNMQLTSMKCPRNVL